ncbi:uncharacterized protein LOC126575814 isoform X4 [Anopheles aquasalis]|uniref:uncharacterized protein LOC126575814 isoform X4 n=1 Tax=Anopheles aquasalis TaxID=42839 RepID=UPI00215A127D|nr:uncharacterized protein LOC126575814 isoform X4 [Anopheles aquasalis]
MNSASNDDALRKPGEIFYSTYEPSKEEILEYAVKIGIDPENETYLVYLARQGLLHPLPENWKPCYSKQIKAYYYYDRATKKSQWEHPIDVLYRAKVADTRKAISSDYSNLNSHTYKFPFKQTPLYPLPGNSVQESDLTTSSTQKSMALNEKYQQNQEQRLELVEVVEVDEIDSNKENDSQEPFPLKTEKRISSIDAIKPARANDSAVLSKLLSNSLSPSFHGFTITGLGSQFLKSNQKSVVKDPEQTKPTESEVKGILRDSNFTYVRGKTTFSEESGYDEKKSVRFDFDHKIVLKSNEPDSIYCLSNTQVSDDYYEKNNSCVESTVEGNKNREVNSGFEIFEHSKELSMNDPSDFKNAKPKMILKSSASTESPTIDSKGVISYHFEKIKERQLHVEDKPCVSSHTTKNDIMNEIEKEYKKYDVMLASEKEHLIEQFKCNADELKKYHQLELGKMERYYGEQNLKEIEAYKNTLKHNFDLTVNSLSNEHREKMATLQKNHDEILHDLERDLKLEEELIKKEHTKMLTDMKLKLCHELELEKQRMREMGEDRLYEKIRCEKRLLEDKYKCLKDKYIRLKSDLRISLERRKKRREMQQDPQLYQNIHNNVLLSKSYETDERSSSNAVSIYPNRNGKSTSRPEVAMTDILSSSNAAAFSISNSYSNNKKTECASRRSKCTPLECLRIQFEKLEELEDQIPESSYDAPYHLRYPFVNKHVENNDSHCHDEECFTEKNVDQHTNNDMSSELEFFKHRIHLERDSVMRAKESLKMQKECFLVKKKNMLIKHAIENEQNVDDILKEQEKLIEMEISLHRTRTLLSEKVIRLRHLERSFNYLTEKKDPFRKEISVNEKSIDTISDHSSYSSSSITDATGLTKHLTTKPMMSMKTFSQSEYSMYLEHLHTEILDIWRLLNSFEEVRNTHQSTETTAPFMHKQSSTLMEALGCNLIVNMQHQQYQPTLSLLEKTRDLKRWLRQAKKEHEMIKMKSSV